MGSPECEAINDAGRCYDPTADNVIGTLLILFTVLGVPANLTSCYLFFKQKSKNSNATYFQRIYMIITAVDAVICGALFPTIQGLLIGRNSDSLLFRWAPFCYPWYFIWIIAQQEAIFLVALLSMSRLYLLRYPLKKLHLPLATASPLVFGVIVLAVLCILPLATGFSHVSYTRELAHCWLTEIQPEESYELAPDTLNTTTTPPPFDPPNGTDVDYISKQMIKTTIESFFFSLPVMPIMTSLVFSLYYINQEIHHQTEGHQGRLVTAAHTVIIVTAVYVLFNLPALAKGIYLTYIYAMAYHHLISNNSYEEFYKFSLATYNSYGRYGWDYLWLFVYTVLPVCKSSLGPVLYFWRIKSFRESMLTIAKMENGKAKGQLNWKRYRLLKISAGKHRRRVEATRHVLSSARIIKVLKY